MPLFVFTTRTNRAPFTDFLRCAAPDLTAYVHWSSYERFLTWRRFPAGTYLFADVDRLRRSEFRFCCRLAAAMGRHPDAFTVLNRPWRVLRRVALNRWLVDQGINRHRVLVADALPDDIRFPVFLKPAKGHAWARSGLLASRAAVEDRLTALGGPRKHWLVIEYEDVRDAAGRCTVYGTSRVGSHVFAKHLFQDTQWELKQPADQPTAACTAEEDRFVFGNPHAERVLPLFDAAGIEYGRIDYSMHAGALRVWEINTNPFLAVDPALIIAERRASYQHGLDALKRAFVRLARRHAPGPAPDLVPAMERVVWRWCSR